MNLKQAKRLRRRALRVFTAANLDATLRVSSNPGVIGTQYEQHARRRIIRVVPDCPRGVYLGFKRTVTETKRRFA